MNPTNPNTPTPVAHEHSGVARLIALGTAAGMLTTGLIANQPPHPGPQNPGVGTTTQEGGLSEGVLHQGSPAQPGDTIRTEHSVTETRSLSVPYSQAPASSFIDAGDRIKLGRVAKEIKYDQKHGWTITDFIAEGRSSDYVTDPDSLHRAEPEVSKPQQDWSKERAKTLSSELDDIVARAGLKNVPKAREETAQDVLNSKEMKEFTKIAHDAGYIGVNAAHAATSDVLGGRSSNPAVKKAVKKYITDNMGGTAKVVAERTTTTFDITREPDIPGTPDTKIVSYNQPPAKLPEMPKMGANPSTNERWPEPKTGGPKQGYGRVAQHNKQPTSSNQGHRGGDMNRRGKGRQS